MTDWPQASDPFKIFADAAGMPVGASVDRKHCQRLRASLPVRRLRRRDRRHADVAVHCAARLRARRSRRQHQHEHSGLGGTAAVSTIAAPERAAARRRAFYINVNPGGSGQGALVANGTASNPIVFTSLSGAPNPGSWAGIQLNFPGSGLSSISHATIDSAGSGYNEACSPMVAAAVLLSGVSATSCVAAPTLSDLTFSNLPPAAVSILAADVTPTVATALATTDGNTFPSTSSGVATCTGELGPNNNWECAY